MELRQMLYFKEVVKHQSFPAAAKALYITPQALGKSMNNLMEEFETEIFFRSHGKLELTTFGKALYQEVCTLLDQMQSMEERLKNIASQENGKIRLAISHGILNGKFKEKIKCFERKYPSIQLDIIELPDIFTEILVANEEYDIGLAINDPTDIQLFETIPLEHYRICAVVHKDHPLAYRREITLKECAQYPIITKNRIFKIHGTMEECARKQNIKLNYALQSPDEIMWRSLLETNQGVGIGTTYYPEAEVPYINFIEEDLNWNIVLIYKKDHYLSRSAVRFIDFMKKSTSEFSI